MFVVGFEVGVSDVVVVGIEVGDDMKSVEFTISDNDIFESTDVEVVDDPEEMLLEGLVDVKVDVVEVGFRIELVSDGRLFDASGAGSNVWGSNCIDGAVKTFFKRVT